MFDTEQDYYIYCYLDEAGEPYYFGKGKGYRAWDKKTHSVELPPEDKIKIVMDGLDEETALKCEKTCIDFYGREKDGGTLKNRYPGGHRGAPRGKENPLYGRYGAEHPMYGKKGAKHPTFGIEGAMKGRTGSKHPTSKKYKVTSPTGETFEIHGLAAFCREHGLSPQNMCSVAKGRVRQAKGWKCAYLE